MITVKYILGFERTGSTLLHDVLSASSNSIGIGESRHIYKRFNSNHISTCGCGAEFFSCLFWCKVLKDLYAVGLNPKEIKVRDSLVILISKSTSYRTYFRKMYAIVARSSSRQIIVDSSKSILQGLILKSIPEFKTILYHTRKHPYQVYISLKKRGAQKKYTGTGQYLLLLKHEITVLTIDVLSLFIKIHNVPITEIHKFFTDNTEPTGLNHSCGGSPSKSKNKAVTIQRIDTIDSVPLTVKLITIYSAARYNYLINKVMKSKD
jgi:hypothetical protein